jgi:predicted porin
LRDIQAGAEIDYLFSPAKNAGTLRQFIGNVTAAAAYSYQDQTSPAILTGPALSTFTGLPGSTTTAYAQRGVIHLGQLRLGFGTGTNTSFPIAFTYSNRTELVVHPTWGLQFGVSYNLTSLFCAPKSGGS